tara:strand:+ start:222 stop:434 length:213 start_codon:yes stop_codon:yes gene_type:complete
MDNDSGDWQEYQKYVLNELQRHNTLLERINDKLSKVDAEIATLKVKSGLWGMLGAAVPLAIAMSFKIFSL